MARSKVRIKLNSRGIQSLETDDPGVVKELERVGEQVLARAQATAPEVTGDYKNTLTMETGMGSDGKRAAVRVGSGSRHGLAVEAAHGTLARALDAAG